MGIWEAGGRLVGWGKAGGGRLFGTSFGGGFGTKMHAVRLQMPDSRGDLLKRVCEAKTAKSRNWFKTMR